MQIQVHSHHDDMGKKIRERERLLRKKREREKDHYNSDLQKCNPLSKIVGWCHYIKHQEDALLQTFLYSFCTSNSIK